MGFMSWLVKSAGFENENDPSDDYKQRAYAEKMRAKEEKRKQKIESKKQKNNPSLKNAQDSSYSQPQAQPSYLNNPDQYNTAKYDSPVNDYGIGASNVGGYGSRNVEFVNPTRFEDVRIIINYLRDGESIMLNLNRMGTDSQRLLDCVSGAVCALNGNLRRVDSNIFLITPEGFNIKVSDNYDH